MLTSVRREQFIEKTVMAYVQTTIMGDRYDGMYL